MVTLGHTAEADHLTCFLEHKLVKPLAGFLILSIAILVGWVTISHLDWLESKVDPKANAKKPFLGLQIVNPDELVARMFSFPLGEAVLVDQVLENSPAQRAGLRRGDGIIAINDRSVGSTTDAAMILDQVKQGDILKLTVIRGGAVQYVLVSLADRPNG